ncbi:hypothetical protein SKAU_G00383770 [Synaphobranchus kaupii]|uniref:Vasoactive intestinal polypeptide receptor 1 n=1 Tax=Synaphobranchus kaupii TaxID=118154 RepID=A0A9Q1IEX2_SYNKA|nr:hypothetical protein SKAU_G00383770 [Synaphobranchus kaupii]
MDASKCLFVLSLNVLLSSVLSVQMCDVVIEIERARNQCISQAESENVTSGCGGMWDIITCWPPASVGEVVTIPCPAYFKYFSNQHKGNLSKMCTRDGWTEMHPTSYALNCGYNLNSTNSDDAGQFLRSVKIGYTIGHSVSLISLTAAIIILCIFRKLHCTRNYIHMHLFVSFILKAVTVFIKDFVLYEAMEPDNCTSELVGCKAVMVFFQYGGPAVFITAWSITKAYFNDVGCWDIIETSDHFWWIIKTPILASILMNFILFICIIRILLQKINCPDIGRNESNQFSRLAKSTLLLIPLFGINYILFAFIPDHMNAEMRLVFDLVLGSFQGFGVAVLYCFLNGEVQAEIKRKWRRWHLERFLGTDMKYQQPSLGSNGNNFSTQITVLTKSSPTTRRPSTCQDDLSSL